jgi:hypothetical protein
VSSAFYLVVKDKPEGLDTFVNGKFLAKANERLSAVALELGAKPLEEFFSANPEAMAELGIDLPGMPEQWYDASDGLATVEALIARLRSRPGDEDIVEDLREFEVVLRKIGTLGLKWHLAVDF